MPRTLIVILVVGLSALAGCGGGGNSATSPSPSYPAVAGNYSGTATFTFQLLQVQLVCPTTTTTITQSGASVALAPLQLSGNCAALGALIGAVPLGELAMTITTTGSLVSAQMNGQTVSFCNGTYNATASGGFAGSTLQFSLNYVAVSGLCVAQFGDFTVSGTLNKT